MFVFTPLLGSQSNSRASQSILELDGDIRILVDVGWDERFDTRQLAEIEKHVSTLSFILLTHATTSHLGAYAHCCKHIPLFTQIPVYATAPVIAFGRTLLQDLYSSSPLAATFIPGSGSLDTATSVDDKSRTNILRQAPTFDEINKYFTLITPLKYSQPHQPAASSFSAPVEGLTLTAYNSGHTLGGTIWHIQHGMESIVYAVDWNQARENVIAGAAWFGGVGGAEVIEQLRKPTALVCSSVGATREALTGGRKARDEHLLAHIRSSVAKGGTVLIPTDSSARVLELAWLLEKAWSDPSNATSLKTAKVYMASRSGNATLRHARSLLEWMDDSIVREFEGEDENVAPVQTHRRSGSKQINGTAKPSRPFQFQNVKIVERKTQFERLLRAEGPRVILASDLTMDWGYARSLLDHVVQRPENLIILTEMLDPRPGSQSPSQVFWTWFRERQDGVALEKTQTGEQLEQVHSGGRMLNLRIVERAPLNTQESQRYQQYIATQRQIQDSLPGNDRDQANAEDNMDDGDTTTTESEQSDDEQQGRVLNVSAAIGHGARNKTALSDADLGVNILIRKKGVYDYDVRNKKGRNALFPYTHSRRHGDEFGDFIKPEDFLREEEKEEQDAANDNKAGGQLGQKRKWDEANDRKQPPNKRNRGDAIDGPAANKSEQDSDADDSDEENQVEHEGFQGPAKIVYSTSEVTVNARLAFVDFAGLHDQRSLQMLIPLIGPRKLILVGGNTSETVALAADCGELLGVKVAGAKEESSTEIFTPAEGQTVDASVDTNAWVVKLSRELAKTLHWQNVKNMGVVTIQGQLKAERRGDNVQEDDPQTKKQKLDTEVSLAAESAPAPPLEPVLDVLPASLAAATRSVSHAIHVGDLRLAELRRLIAMDGHAAEFRGEGTLLVDGMIAVRKLGTGKIIVEGVPVSAAAMTPNTVDNFTRVKQKIYDGLAVVAAG
ncbi:putative cleavage and polyadenylylation specificity factor [Cladophialophora carrionii]|uniref:Cleavage and polyadenylation specificity factor subunit 2 n=1 Tax=Cladophialophora carrionii TaxID=86049 RepID=A0A1C1CPC9_9EURO|nr:putative cleavage and polyadenylylation specificity factor [Cladophialophora carrionii]